MASAIYVLLCATIEPRSLACAPDAWLLSSAMGSMDSNPSRLSAATVRAELGAPKAQCHCARCGNGRTMPSLSSCSSAASRAIPKPDVPSMLAGLAVDHVPLGEKWVLRIGEFRADDLTE